MPDFSPVEMSAEVGELAKALAAAQAGIRPAAKDATNPHFKSRYADLAAIHEACRDALSASGIAVVQCPSAEGALVTVTTMLLHESGQWLRSGLTMTARDAGPQSVGSAVTYGRRYGLAAMVGVVADEDDDGNAAQPAPREPQRPRAVKGSKPGTAAETEAEARQVLAQAIVRSGGVERHKRDYVVSEPGAAGAVYTVSRNDENQIVCECAAYGEAFEDGRHGFACAHKIAVSLWAKDQDAALGRA